jgi:hypothetical protein
MSWPLKARNPVLASKTSGPFYGGLLFFASCVLSRCTSASPLATRQNPPGIWTLRCQPKTLSMLRSVAFLSGPPPTSRFHSRASNLKPDTCVQTGGASQGRTCGESVDDGEVKRGMTTVSKSTTRKYQDRHAFSKHPRQECGTPHEQNGSTKDGRREERNMQYAAAPPRSTPPCGLRAAAVSCPFASVARASLSDFEFIAVC